MFISYFDDKRVSEQALKTKIKKLDKYRKDIQQSVLDNNSSVPEYSLFHCKDFDLHESLDEVKKKFKGVKHVVVIGIGGSSLGLEAIHSVLDEGKVGLSVLDTVSAHQIKKVADEVLALKSPSKVAVCVISKSGKTTETLTNATVLLEILVKEWGIAVYSQVAFVGEADSEMMKYGKKKGIVSYFMPKIIGGRYSMATVVGLIPMTLLGHDVDDFIAGYLDASEEKYESLVAESAARIATYYQLKYPHYNFFAFEPRLEKLGRWYRQLFAESLGKEVDKDGKPVKHAMVPTISTAVELHSVGQLYMSGVPDTYTDFVTFDDEKIDMNIAKSSKLASGLGGYSVQEVATALYGGVMGAYQERSLPFRATIFEEALPYSLGLFMGMRLREVMYVSHLLNVNAFDQPNVELYKIKTKDILKI
jgi:glucose-6-phosphate isomerase